MNKKRQNKWHEVKYLWDEVQRGKTPEQALRDALTGHYTLMIHRPASHDIPAIKLDWLKK